MSGTLGEAWVTAEDAVAYQFLPVTVHFIEKNIRGGYERFDYLDRSEEWVAHQLSALPDGHPEDFCDAHNILETVLEGRSDVIDCFEARVGEVMPPFPHGSLTTHFRVQADGTTSNVGFLRQKAFGEKLQQCVGDVIAELEFDDPVGGICVIYFPLRFRATETTGVVHVEIEN
ncbi:hypothetical protein FRC91_09890 [Bradymonadales bacterium TMQ1]|nr:hypothetical protein FRC91_09890 [Bradymonadales bacterium TMQ1]